MSYVRETALGSSFPPFVLFLKRFGFVPKLFRCQSLLPRVIEAETALVEAILLKDRTLPRLQKEQILLRVAAADRNLYCVTMHYQMLCLLGMPEEQIDRILSGYPTGAAAPPESADPQFEVVLVTALGKFLCTLATGLGAEPDFEPISIASNSADPPTTRGSSLQAPARSAEEFSLFAFFPDRVGFIPNILRAQTVPPDVVEAEAGFVRDVLLTDDILTRAQKQSILLAVSATSRNPFYEVHLSEADNALLDFALRLAAPTPGFSHNDLEPLRGHGFTDEQILEAVVITSFANFLNALQQGLGAGADFPPQLALEPTAPKTVHLFAPDPRPTHGDPADDPDVESVARVQTGDLDAFEDLMNRHGRRVYRTLVGILGNPEEARDAMQDTFLKAFQHLSGFQGRSRFSTWLVSIAHNTGLQMLRERRHTQSIDYEHIDSEQRFRPQQIRAWTDDPEQLYSKVEMRGLVEDKVMKLPAKYRVVLVLRDMEHLSIEEAAEALGLSEPALKARLLRGRLMLREALAPHFTGTARGGAV